LCETGHSRIESYTRDFIISEQSRRKHLPAESRNVILLEPENPWFSQGLQTVGHEGVQDEGDREQVVILGRLRDVAIGPFDTLSSGSIPVAASLRGVARRLSIFVFAP
jgi:hypothetical protein